MAVGKYLVNLRGAMNFTFNVAKNFKFGSAKNIFQLEACSPVRYYTSAINTISNDRMFCLADFEEKAKENLDKRVWDYYASGANQQQSLRDNVEAFSRCTAN